MKITDEKYTTAFNHISEISLSIQVVNKCSHSGPCDNDVKECMELPEVKEEISGINHYCLREELKEYGCWEWSELQDHKTNLERILWLAACNIKDEISS